MDHLLRSFLLSRQIATENEFDLFFMNISSKDFLMGREVTQGVDFTKVI